MHWPARHLGFLIEFLRTQHPEGIQVCAVSRIVGVSSPNVSALLHKDDAKLSTIVKFFNAYGYKLILDFHKDTTPLTINPYVASPNTNMLSDLRTILFTMNQTIHSISINTGVDDSVVKHAFEKGNIKISTLYKMIEAYGVDLTVKWKNVSGFN